MKSDAKTFAIVVIIVLILAGGAFILGKNSKGQSNDSGDQTANMDDSGNVNGASTDDQGVSMEYKEKLAKFLTTKGAVLYGAYWCPHCKDQKALFGDAVKYINYVECDAAGENANPDECQAKDIKSYPTWIYQGQKYTGAKPLSELAAMVGFTETSSEIDASQTDPVS